MTTVIVPDYMGHTWSKNPKFYELIKEAVPGCVIIPVFNSKSEDDYHALFSLGNEVCEGIIPAIYCGDLGLTEVLKTGYQTALEVGSEGPVIRIDTEEHPPEMIGPLLEALKSADMVIGDLDFSKGHLRPESIDEFVHLDVFPALYSFATEGKLRLSCAHGFQSFVTKDALQAIFSYAALVLDRLAAKGKRMPWGLDGAMALSAVHQGFEVRVVAVEAQSDRDRDRAKIASQFEDALTICTYFRSPM